MPPPGASGVGDAQRARCGSCVRFYARTQARGRRQDLGPAAVEDAPAPPDPERRGRARRARRPANDVACHAGSTSSARAPKIAGGEREEQRAEHRERLHERRDRARGLRLLERAVAGLDDRIREPRRRDRADAEPREEQAVLTPMNDGSRRQSFRTNTVTALPSPMTRTPGSARARAGRRGRRRRARRMRRAARSRSSRRRRRCARSSRGRGT